jgi:hypothetical protein
MADIASLPLVKVILNELLPGIDDDTTDYFVSLITENFHSFKTDENVIRETLTPFIESYGISETAEGTDNICSSLFKRLNGADLVQLGQKTDEFDQPVKLSHAVTLSSVTNQAFSQSEKAAINLMWGFDQIRNKRNDMIEVTEAGSAKYERKALRGTFTSEICYSEFCSQIKKSGWNS